MGIDQWAVIVALLIAIVGVFSGRGQIWWWFVFPSISLYLFGVIELTQLVTGITNEGLLTLAGLMIIAHAVQNRGLLEPVVFKLLFKWGGSTLGYGFFLALVATLSGFLNNTPIVAMLIQPIRSWAVKVGKAPSQLLLPLSYTTIIGGTLTVVGTSTNLVVYGYLLDAKPDISLSLFAPAIVGLPLMFVGIAFYMVFSGLLPVRHSNPATNIQTREFQIPAQVSSSLEGKTLEEAQLRRLAHGYLYRILRENGDVLPASGSTLIRNGDTFIFSGTPELVAELRQHKEVIFNNGSSSTEGAESHLIEAIIPFGSPLIGHSVKDLHFRTEFGGVIISIGYQQDVIQGGLGKHQLQAGDLLLIDVADSTKIVQKQRSLMVLNQLKQPTTVSTWQGWLILALLPLCLAAAAIYSVSVFKLILFLLILALVLQVINLKEAANSLVPGLFLTLGGALALAEAVVHSGISELVFSHIPVSGLVQWQALAVIFICTWVITEFLTNNTAAALMMPFALSFGSQTGLSVAEVAVTVMVSASMSFITPYGYQTNLMVMSPGNYVAKDYLKFGSPLVIAGGVLTVLLVNYFY